VDVCGITRDRAKGGIWTPSTPETFLRTANITANWVTLRFVQAVVPFMRKQRWGRIIEINALAGSVQPREVSVVINRASCVALSKSLGHLSLPRTKHS